MVVTIVGRKWRETVAVPMVDWAVHVQANPKCPTVVPIHPTNENNVVAVIQQLKWVTSHFNHYISLFYCRCAVLWELRPRECGYPCERWSPGRTFDWKWLWYGQNKILVNGFRHGFELQYQGSPTVQMKSQIWSSMGWETWLCYGIKSWVRSELKGMLDLIGLPPFKYYISHQWPGPQGWGKGCEINISPVIP